MNNKQKGKHEKRYRIYFLAAVLLLYLVLLPFTPEGVRNSLWASGSLLIKIIPVFLLVILFMAAIQYFFTPKSIAKYVGKESGIKGWLLAIGTGILSHGPIYAWYPALKELRQHGMRSGLVAVFLYNRAIKIPLLPVIVYYFGIQFVGILLVWMIIASVVEGKIIEIIER
jgi:uncharacterized membrane protein YraQ (UPF0718 family)